LREPGSGVRDSVLKQFAAAGLQPRVRMQLGSNEAIKHAIVGGLGISALSLHSLTLESGGGRLALLDIQGFPIMRRWHLVHWRGRELSLGGAHLPRLRDRIRARDPRSAGRGRGRLRAHPRTSCSRRLPT
jgi:DNA-binding transcriptional LysR family regulator